MNETGDLTFEELRGLQTLLLDPGRAEQIRTRCRAQLVRAATHCTRQATEPRLGPQVVTRVVLATFCLLYVTALITTALRIFN